MFARCEAPIWREDDFTACFRRDYLTVLLPLIVCAISFLILVYAATDLVLRPIRLDGYHDLGTNITALIGTLTVDTLGLADDPGPRENSRGPDDPPAEQEEITAEVSRPRAALQVIILETLCLLGVVGLSLGFLVVSPSGTADHRAEIATLIVWLYTTTICLLRLYFQVAKIEPLPGLWNHTALLYGTFWLFLLVTFRSSIIHPPSTSILKDLTIARFALVTVLLVISLSVRRGNRAVLLARDHGTAPSREPLASLASIATFSWLDGFIWNGWKKPLEIEDIWNVLPKERAAVVLTSFRQYRRTTKLAVHLIKYFTWDLLFQQIWAIIAGITVFVPTLLLKAILEYVEDTSSIPTSTAWLWVVLLLVIGCLTGVAEGQALWRGRKICISLRAILIGEIYAKTLRRKAASSGDKDMNAAVHKSESHKQGAIRALWSKLFGNNQSDGQQAEVQDSEPSKTQSDDKQVNSGTILNLMSVDSFRVSEISAYFHFLIPTVPVQLVMAITLLFRVLGWSAIAGVVVMAAVLPLNMAFARRFSATHKRIMAATDKRIHTTNEVLQNVRIIKFFAWEDRFASSIDEKRHGELAAIRYRFGLWATASVVWFGVPLIITMVSFFLYTVVEKKQLVPSVAFTALSLFNLLRYPLDRFADMLAHTLESKVSIDRVETFLSEEETGKYSQLEPESESNIDTRIGFSNATFSWGPRDEPLEASTRAFRLINMDIDFRVGGLNIIAGPTGSGKTSLLMALLGEMTLISGKVHLPGGYNRSLLKPGPDGLTESVAYCAQQAWLVNDTIKQNILFASPYDEHRYRQVIAACALQRDLEVFERGDATPVGEKGVVVSGGQKQRISLARALYSDCRHILLDDCLSAVDSHTAQHIFDNCIVGPLMANRTCVLVTHNVALCVPRADHVVVLRNGKIAGQGVAQEMLGSGLLGNESSKSQSESAHNTRPGSRSGLADENDVAPPRDTNGKASYDANGHSDAKPKVEPKDDDAIHTEAKAVGAVDLRVIWLYLRAMGPWYLWSAILVAYSLENIANVSTNVWIRQWANSYATKSVQVSAATGPTQWTSYAGTWLNPMRPILTQAPWSVTFGLTSNDNTPVREDTGYYLGIYGILAASYILVALVRLGLLFKGSLNASRNLHARLLNAVLRAKFKFFDTTPLGQIMNRFSKDLQAIDQDIAPGTAGVLQCAFSLLVIVILISVITPAFLVAGVFLSVLYFAIGALYLETSRDLKRLESTQRSPLYQQFGETLSGIITIRAYGDERRFIDDNAQRINTYNRPFIFLWGANRWLALRVDFAGALVSFFAATFIVLQADTIDPGAAGLSLSYALGFNESILWLVREYAEYEQNMNHVERVKDFLEVEQEAPAHVPEKKPSGEWPSKGAIRFEKYTTRYREGLEPVLVNLNISIKGEEKVGIVGRTGAGKSSLALALFRGLEADSGQIFIDDVDIGTIGLQDLRENLTVVPQDPTLFTGTIRTNLDPFGLFADEEIFTALRQVHLIGPDAANAVAQPAATTLADIDEASVQVDELEAATATGDMSAPAPLRRSSISAVPVTGEGGSRLDLAHSITNSRENSNIFLDLSSPVAESGGNLSQGQRQLLCLARALLKAPRVLLMDEATASIDYETDAKIQETLREVRGSTLVTIAHRLQTIVDYDKVLVLEKGEVAEFGPPWELIRNEDGMFRGMCERTGDFDVLLAAAQRAEKKNQLIDVDE